jgi:hypothetical protein
VEVGEYFVSTMKRYAIGVVLCLSLGSFGRSARADEATDAAAANYARELFERADAAMRNTPPDYDAACEGFRKAFEIAHGLGALKKQAVCEEARGRLATALALWTQAVGMPQADDRKAEAQKQVTALEGKVGRLLVEAPARVGKLSVTVDGAAWPTGEAKPIDGGSHRVSFEETDQDGRASTEVVVVDVLNGTTATARAPKATSDRPATAPQTGHAPSGSDGRSTLRAAGFAMGGIGVAGLVAFGVTGGLVVSTHSALRDACANHTSEPYSGCNADAPSLASKGSALNVANAVSLGVGVAALGTSIPLLVLGYKAQPRASALVVPWADPQSAGLVARGAF